MIIDPGVVSLIQAAFLEHIVDAFEIASKYAFNLLYLFAAIEITVLGLAWALQRDIGWDKLFFKIIKIGLIFLLIQNYPWILNTILSSFAKLAGIVVKDGSIAEYVFNPAKIWQYGYNIGINLLKLATISNVYGLVLIQMYLGLGILLVFGLLGIQMVIQIIGFYLVSFSALIFLPFGALSPSKSMLDKSVKAVFQAGLRLMVVIIIIGIAVLTWQEFQFTDLETTANFNLNQPLGLFFTTLLFLLLSFYLPKMVSQVVGDFSSSFFEGSATVVATTSESVSISNIAAMSPGLSNMQAATVIQASGGTRGGYESISSVAQAATMPTTITGAGPLSGSIDTKAAKEGLDKASTDLSKSISNTTVKKIKEAVAKAMQEKPSK